jgi:uridine kinase
MRPLIVGIAGGTASGKTTTAAALGASLGARCVLIHHDRYYRSMPETFHADPAAYNFDHPDALDTARLISDLKALKSGQSVELPRYDFARHRRSEETDRVSPCPVFLVEGILVLADSGLRELFDKKIYVHAPEDLRLTRRIRRDMESRGRSEADILSQWERSVSPMHHEFVEPSRLHADLVIDGMTTTDAMVAAVLRMIGPI